MLARQHANLGIAGYLTTTIAVSSIGFARPDWLSPELADVAISLGSPTSLLILGIIAGTFALVPDFDEPGSTISRQFGKVSQFISSIFRVVAFGHRGLSHTIWFALVMGMLGIWVQRIPGEWSWTIPAINVDAISLSVPEATVVLSIARVWTSIILLVCASVLLNLVIRGRGKTRRVRRIMILLTLAVMMTSLTDIVPEYGVGWAMFSGIVWHCVGDQQTHSGNYFFWLPLIGPLQRIRIRFPWHFRTGSAVEESLVRPILILAALVAVAGSVFWSIYYVQTLNPEWSVIALG